MPSGSFRFAGLHPVVYKAWVTLVWLPAGLAVWVCSSGTITFVTSGEQTWQPIIQPRVFLLFHKFRDFFGFEKPCLQALAGQPSLHGYDAFIVYWVQRALRRHRRQKQSETSFSPSRVFPFSRNSRFLLWGFIK